MRSFKSNENIHKKGDGSYYVVSEHKALNSSKGIIRDKALKGESDDNIRENKE